MLIHVPESWPMPLSAALAMAVLAALDLAGAVAAKEAVERDSPLLACTGLALFVALFWVYASSLQYAELAPVTLGWIVILQIAVVILDRHLYLTPTPRGTWLAVAVMITAQAWLLLGPHPSGPGAADRGAAYPHLSRCPPATASSAARGETRGTVQGTVTGHLDQRGPRFPTPPDARPGGDDRDPW